VSLLTASALTLLGAGAWWWVTWPERTAREFIERLGAQDWDGAERMIAYQGTENSKFARTAPRFVDGKVSWTKTTPQPQSFTEFVCGRRLYRFGDDLYCQFVAQRGSIIRNPYLMLIVDVDEATSNTILFGSSVEATTPP
jgi:hypothetical protein